MNYRHLGKAGIQVSELSFGSWVTFHHQAGVEQAVEMMAAAYEAGVNFFDNAEVYAGGKSEEVMGATLAQFSLAWCLQNPYVSTVITGASRVEQVHENMKALQFVDKFTPDVMAQIDEVFGVAEETED